MDDTDPLEHMVQEVAKFVNPKKEYAKIKATRIKPRRPPRTKPQGGIDPPETKLKRKTAQDKASKKDIEGKKSDGWKAGALAAGIASVAVIGGIAAAAAAEMKKCDDATMTITSINPTGRTSNTNTNNTTTSNNFMSGLFSSFTNAVSGLSPSPTTVDIKFTMNNDYAFNEGHDEVEISGTGTELDGMGPILVNKLVDSTTIRVNCATNDCSNIYATSGTGEPQCAIEDAINKGLKDAIAGPIDAAKDLLGSVFDAFSTFVGPIVIGICIVLLLIIVLPLLFSLFKRSPKPEIPIKTN